MRRGRSWQWVVLWSLWAARLVRQPTAPLRVAGGMLRGAVAHDGSHRHYLAIPYATLAQEHRFKAPGPEPTWEGILEAENENIRCPQFLADMFVMGQENCLTLNVYTPLDTTPDERLPVMVFVHGGGYFIGSGSRFLYGPEYLVANKVILVTLNYRLNIQGFLCLGIKEAPGNAGMKDQVAALKWVQRNIRVFGGDPDNVTIFGESAGAVSVSYHILSPMSKGLFHKAITQSGSALTPWALQDEPVHVASLSAKAMGLNTQDPYELYNIFKNKTDTELISTFVPREEGNTYISELMYVPCIENIIEGVEPFLTELPYDLLVRGDYNKVPMIVGTNNEEGYLFVALENDKTLSEIKFEKTLPKHFAFSSEAEKKEVAQTLKRMYLGSEEISSKTKLKLSRYYGDMHFSYPSLRETELLLQTNDKPIYNYLFSYDGWRNFGKLISGFDIIMAPGASHADDVFYLFKQCMVPALFESGMIDIMTKMWTDFAKFGEPTPAGSTPLAARWRRTRRPRPHALVLDAEPREAPLWHRDALRYWRQLYAKHRTK